MIVLEMESPGLAGTKARADKDPKLGEDNPDENPLQTAKQSGPRLLVTLAAWLVRMELRRRERHILAGWDTPLSLQLDQLTDIRERLSEYLDADFGARRKRPQDSSGCRRPHE